MDILRFITAGSVDDGKSTLIGRLLYDSKNVLTDQLEAIERQGKTTQDGKIDLALLTDGLRAEREQGITIDVAYKYFNTAKRKFIIADCPGHVQYTRNMVTGASNSDLMIILIDARQGVVEQTKRHSIIASLLKLPYTIVAINKMDLVGFDEVVFDKIKKDYAGIAESLSLQHVSYIPMSALNGDNIVEKSDNMGWYDGPALLDLLESTPIQDSIDHGHPRFPVQLVIRPQLEGLHDYRGYAGKVISGSYQKGDKIVVWPSGLSSSISQIEEGGKEVAVIRAPQSGILHLADDVDISRGDTIALETDSPVVSKEVEALLCWMDTKPLLVGNKYLLQKNSQTVKAMIKSIEYKLEVTTLQKVEDIQQAGLNDIIKVKIKTASPLVFDPYPMLRANGGGILIDETSNSTVGACMIEG